MIYYTRYNLITLPKGSLKDADILNCLHYVNPIKGFNRYSSFTEWAEEPRRWYCYDYDMTYLSSCYPNVTFILAGSGENVGDVWKRYYKNGHCVQCIKAVLFFEENPILSEAQDYEKTHNLFPFLESAPKNK